MADANPRIEGVTCETVSKTFGAMRALSNVSFNLAPKEVVALMGPNGAGKSTLLQILSLSMRPTRGTIRFNGTDARQRIPGIFQKIGLLSHQPRVYPDLTCRENLYLFAKLNGIANRQDAVHAMESALGMNDFATDRPTRVLSRGQLQRIALAGALICEPDLLLLDEPAAGLDQIAVGRIDTAVKDLTARGGMAVIVTHEPGIAARLATRAMMMRGGQVVADRIAPGTLEDWNALYDETAGAA